MKSKIFWIAVALMVVASLAAIKLFLAANSRETFVANWSLKLKLAKSADDSTFLNSNDNPKLIDRRKFQNGEWIIFVNASSDGGDNFNATVCRDSNGSLAWSEFAFSGYEGLEERLSQAPDSALKDFWAHWKKYGWKLIVVK